MEMMQLEMFVAVVEERSVVKAADRVGRTQPAVTLAIGKLEKGVGCPVLDRSRARDYRPTPTGEILYEYASRILGLRNEVSAILSARPLPAAELSIGASGAGSLEQASQWTRAFSARHPEVQIRVVSDGADRVLSELTDRKLDLALLASMPAGAERNMDLVVSPFRRGTRRAQFWTVERRVGRSHVAELFSEMLGSLPSSPKISIGHASRIRSGRMRLVARPAK